MGGNTVAMGKKLFCFSFHLVSMERFPSANSASVTGSLPSTHYLLFVCFCFSQPLAFGRSSVTSAVVCLLFVQLWDGCTIFIFSLPKL